MPHQPRIQLTDTMQDIIMKMSDGNPGAITVLVDIINNGATIDPDDFMGGLGTILSMDTYGLYGSDIWVLYKDHCNSNLVNLIGLFRAVQLGVMTEFALKNMIGGGRAPAEDVVETAVAKVREILPSFGV